ncbi:MAG: site-specific DNA-methyltransferase [Chloroflexales bacterium]|nr:site-specific DNA-methyltransferase [Chloroflexales bacterium]
MPRQRSNPSQQIRPSAIPQPPEGHYAGDKPNPNLRAFVEAHLRERPYDPTSDQYAVPAFDQPIETTKATAVYDVHSYWSKKPHEAIRQYIRHYTQPGDLVLDPFCGSGSTGIAALLDDRKAAIVDLSPAATFIAASTVDIFTCQDFDIALEQLTERASPLVNSRFQIPGEPGVIRAIVYTERFRCSRCFRPVAFLEARSGDERQFRGVAKAKEQCPYCGEPLRTNNDERLGFVPGEIHISKDYRAKRIDKLNVLGRNDIEHLFPVTPTTPPLSLKIKLEENIQPRLWKNLAKAGAVYASDLFSDANLAVLLEIERQIFALDGLSQAAIRLLRLCVHAILYNCTRMYRYRTHTAGGGGFSGTYYIPHLSKCINPWSSFLDKCGDIKRAILEVRENAQASNAIMVSTESAGQLARGGKIAANSVDYIFTDPPYGGTYHYGALNFLWEAWRKSDLSWRGEEIIITEDGSLTYDNWKERLRAALSDSYTLLKPGRWISLCFHGEVELWQAVNDIMAEIGFIPSQADRAIFIDTKQKSYNQRTGATAKKRDLVISFRKPRPGEAASQLTISGDEDGTTFSEQVRAVIRTYLADHPGSTKDRIYDQVVSRMVRAGRMEAHDFDELLAQVAEAVREPVMANLVEPRQPDLFGAHRIMRWYLKETALAVEDAAESAREEAAAKQVRGFIAQKLAAEPAAQGVPYNDIFEHYVYSVKDKPRRTLADWLLEYLYKTDAGTYRPPASEEEEGLKAQARAAGTYRRIRRYVAYLQQGVAVPERERPGDGTLAEWLRQCKRAGLYELGKLLYQRGGLDLDRLSEEQQIAVEEDYQTCVRMHARAAAAPERKGRGASPP